MATKELKAYGKDKAYRNTSKRSIEYTEVGKWGKYLRDVWEREFAESISSEERGKYRR
ncbi:DUF4275 family protein [Paenibacillus sp. FSL K6-1217]|uniref:DUF4275 family protein n=1 Tax=Paenibacillus sp. FSL K6-1217 TaxID=2921466 RepID=UPI003870AD46